MRQTHSSLRRWLVVLITVLFPYIVVGFVLSRTLTENDRIDTRVHQNTQDIRKNIDSINKIQEKVFGDVSSGKNPLGITLDSIKLKDQTINAKEHFQVTVVFHSARTSPIPNTILAIRDESGGNFDHHAPPTQTTPESTTVIFPGRLLAPGTYKVQFAYDAGGNNWTAFRPAITLTVTP